MDRAYSNKNPQLPEPARGPCTPELSVEYNPNTGTSHTAMRHVTSKQSSICKLQEKENLRIFLSCHYTSDTVRY